MDIVDVAELAAKKYYGDTPSDDAGLEDIDFENAIQNARAKQINIDYLNFQRITGEKGISQSWIQTYQNIPVLFNTDTQTYYSVLPSQYMGLPQGLGIYHISPMQAIQKPFSPQTIGESFLFTRNPQDTISYYADTDNVYYTRFDPAITQVLMQLIPLTSDIIPDDFVYDVIDLALKQFLMPRMAGQVSDKLDDQNPNRTEVGIK